MFAQCEHALKRSHYLKPNKKHAEADWDKFAATLGEVFFDEISASKKARTLIDEPPRKLMADGLTWSPERPTPLKNVRELFVRGVCQVRNNLVHGEKHALSHRDNDLILQASLILRAAIKGSKDIQGFF
jgi:hypothetical protein